jgi:hypothetical protein
MSAIAIPLEQAGLTNTELGLLGLAALPGALAALHSISEWARILSEPVCMGGSQGITPERRKQLRQLRDALEKKKEELRKVLDDANREGDAAAESVREWIKEINKELANITRELAKPNK